jgi:hypothetical protein
LLRRYRALTLISRRDAFAIALLLALPVIAHAPALLEERLLGPGDGAALHYPLRAEVWAAFRRGELPAWNPWLFSGTPLLAAYRPGALHPLMPLLAILPTFAAFQALVLVSLSLAGFFLYLYVRRLGGSRIGAYVAGLSFGLGPYLVGHLGDTAAIVAAPALPLLLLALEALLRRASAGRFAGVALAAALVLLAGSPEAARAGAALAVGRVAVAYMLGNGQKRLERRNAAYALVAGVLLAAPQLLPALAAAQEAGRQVTGLAPSPEARLPGLTGFILRYVSHTPAGALAFAALPLAATQMPVRVLGIALLLCLGLQWGRGPLAAPGALALVFDLALAILAGLSLSAQWTGRQLPEARRLRLLFLLASLASAAALSISAAALGPLPQTLAGSVGVLTLALILYFSQAMALDPVKAHVFLLPLTVSFVLQPQSRDVWAEAPTREQLERPSPTREAIERAVGPRPERVLTLATVWPKEALDLGFANAGALHARRSANGYDPMVPLRSRAVFDGMGPAGTLPSGFLHSDPRRLELLGLRFLQIPTSALVAGPEQSGLGEPLEVVLEPGRSRYFPLPIVPATEIRLVTALSDAADVGDGELVARVHARLATGRELPLVLLAGRDTADSGFYRSRARRRMRHQAAKVFESWQDSEGSFGHRYLAVLTLPGRYFVDGVRIEAAPGPFRATLSRLAVADAPGGRATPASAASAYVSDVATTREVAATPAVRLFELPGSPGQARVVSRVRLLPDDAAVLQQLAAPTAAGVDPRNDALASAGDGSAFELPRGSRARTAELARAAGARIDVRAEGPGLLVLAEGYSRGWRALVDGAPAPVLRVNHAQLGVMLPAGLHRIDFRYRPPGFAAGACVSLATLAALGAWAAAAKRRPAARARPLV